MQVTDKFLEKANSKLGEMNTIRQPYYSLWKECADYVLPRRYVWLNSSSAAGRVASMRNPHILDATGTIAARVLAAGMMNGITSPARPWFKLRIAGRKELAISNAAQIWLDEVTTRMMLVMNESNFYNAMAVMYLDLTVFGTAAMLIYDDYQSVIRCYNPALGEYYLSQDDRLSVNTFGRKFHMTVGQIVKRWGEENVSQQVKDLYRKGGASCLQSIEIHHLIEPNDDGLGKVNKKFPFRETYWEAGSQQGIALAQNGFRELPGLFPRWELCANDSYGSCPAMEALGDIKQLQQETLRKAQGIDKTVTPPVLADIQLQNKPTALIPGAVTYVSGGTNNIGVKPIYQVTLPLAELSADIAQIQERIREIFHNPLFTMISQLDTVRSATEIDARREEKLVLLGSVLERFENEALDPAINRIYSIMQRNGLIPEPPADVAEMDLEIQYVSILSTAQKAIGAAPTERWVGFIGNLLPVAPQLGNVPNWEELAIGYGRDIGVPAKYMNDIEQAKEATAAQSQQQNEAQGLQSTDVLTKAAQQLSAVDVGGGANAVQALLGG